MYLEPTTGRVYSVTRCPYLKIDLIWNHRNLWVNMQAHMCPLASTSARFVAPLTWSWIFTTPDISSMSCHLLSSTVWPGFLRLDAENPAEIGGEADDTGLALESGGLKLRCSAGR